MRGLGVVRQYREYAVVALACLVVLASAGVALGATGRDANGVTRVATAGDADAGGDGRRLVAPGVETGIDTDLEAPTDDGVARVGGDRFETLRAALDAADPGDTVRLHGRFDGPVTVETPNVTLTSASPTRAAVVGDGEGTVLTLAAADVTVHGVWVRNAGWEASENDAAVWITGHGSSVEDSRVSNTTFGIWVDGATDVRLVNNTVVGRESVTPLTKRGNGIQLWRATDAYVAGNRITDVRDGVYYSWASGVVAEDNEMWDIRYGVHYMYSDDCVLRNNTAVDNDVGYALMLSERLAILNNTAVDNDGESGHGVMVKSIDHSVIRGNDLVGNEKGLFVYNSLNNTLSDNLVLENTVGVHLSAGSVRERVSENSFIHNDEPVVADISQQVAWNGTARGNYWSGATVADTDDDGVSETRYQPTGLVEQLVSTTPSARLFVDSPAFALVRRAERTVPIVEGPGVVDQHPLARPPHDEWRRYYAHD
ncbi:nitrous oxidase accessory protein [Halogranum gelatinilyticum]|uniref:Nitrous oxidase accessory protein n=1 Tax=Halogranum gelatinilyticum TaxID=660521 RepID=A0A1G9YQ30_9EURY|nr:nitrous oxide reductase family maturation protein NosD [Halogranum gelatinilyticum]SDN10526.1 nitrous oxidase accessory protein [Halogranum gelatinilyticum]